ncbi:MAG: prephenate dehydratase [Opitutales bacterium]|jgi:chorismate mutase/prephenate dehydratase
MDDSLKDIRDNIDSIDREIVERLNERVRLACEIGKIKLGLGQEIYVPSREEEVFDKLAASSKGPLPEKALRRIYREVISAAVALEKPMTVAYLGPEGTYTHQAAMKQFGSSCNYSKSRVVPDVFAAVKRGDADYGLVPVENSTQGTVLGTLDTLVESDLQITAQVYLEINHYLVSLSPLSDIKTVFSKDNALGQCRIWLSKMLPEAEQIACDSTAAAVVHARDNPGTAAIGSRIAAEMYNVPIVAENIADVGENVTRFIVIGKHSSPPLGNGRDRTSIVFTIRDKPGQLLNVLGCFSRRGLNLCKIESRPTRQRAWDYFFYIDFIGHMDDPDVKEALVELESLCPMVRWLGSYPNTGL